MRGIMVQLTDRAPEPYFACTDLQPLPSAGPLEDKTDSTAR